ncbi:hypothetical protein HPP92_018702 [Vanilla planifolia]|uniref:Uncharacterized protein n=1 Tax=Vanilla planifolia TaxID=51239 RepID=A0A835UN50_VANPL|nr:hypothetical protein HPP92_018702 [Vanilla planifolia]
MALSSSSRSSSTATRAAASSSEPRRTTVSPTGQSMNASSLRGPIWFAEAPVPPSSIPRPRGHRRAAEPPRVEFNHREAGRPPSRSVGAARSEVPLAHLWRGSRRRGLPVAGDESAGGCQWAARRDRWYRGVLRQPGTVGPPDGNGQELAAEGGGLANAVRIIHEAVERVDDRYFRSFIDFREVECGDMEAMAPATGERAPISRWTAIEV